MGREIEWVFPKTCGSCIKLSRRVVDLESALAAAKERIAELESENDRLRAEVERLTALVQEHQTYTPKQSIKQAEES